MQPTPMDSVESVSRSKPGQFTSVIASGLLGFLVSLGLTMLAVDAGFLFRGLTSFFSLVLATVACWIVAGVSAVVWARKSRQLSWRMLTVVMVTTAAIVIGCRSWRSTRNELEAWLIAPLPKSVRVHRGEDLLFSSWVHFSAPPEVLASIIRSKKLTLPVDEEEKREEQKSMKGSFERQDPEWWLPGALEKPRFYLHIHHESQQPWIQGLWVNEAMTEAYAFIKG